MATWNTDVLAVQNGTSVYTGSTEVTYYDVIQGAEGKFKTKFTAIGAVGSEIGTIYKVSEDGTYSASFSQVQEATTAGTFAYESATKTITFASDDDDAPGNGEYIACAYKFKTASNAQKITINSDGIPPTVLVSAYGLARDTCSGELFPVVVEGTAQVDGNWNFDLSSDGEPVVQNLSMEFVKGCLSKELYSFTIFTEDEFE